MTARQSRRQQPLGNPDLQVTLRDYHQPRVTADTYTVEATHDLIHPDLPPDYKDRLPKPVSQSFEVRAVQFLLDTGYVHSAYPPAGSTGRYTSVLPHITLSRDVLPWERRLQGIRVDERAPWLALLVFAEDELPADPSAAGVIIERPVADLLTPPRGLHGPAIDPASVPTDVLDSYCRTIDVPVSVFEKIVPREDELLYTAHTREVTVPSYRSNGDVIEPGEFAVLTATRFPRDEGSYVVHLVSLEGFEGRLDEGALPAAETVRLCSLHVWAFACDTTNTLDPDALLRGLADHGREDPHETGTRIPRYRGRIGCHRI
ncbi:hypothetical protein GCM10010260_83630 [Streptomyces filipinensis]|uniref:Uncharacterized protein n=1 Tax=Streptomyces filipinensis TaxID=66887 RepID=A0A918MFN8_9ACTN|nr:hypothetical protein GCM10010260_83630 [Streptomyces filipinensis]